MTREEKIKLIADHYGYDRQCKQLMEEMGELTQAVCKVWRANNDMNLRSVDYSHMNPYLMCSIRSMIGECADVCVMIHQIAYLTGMEPEIERIMDQKLDRQIQRIKEKKHEGRKKD